MSHANNPNVRTSISSQRIQAPIRFHWFRGDGEITLVEKLEQILSEASIENPWLRAAVRQEFKARLLALTRGELRHPTQVKPISSQGVAELFEVRWRIPSVAKQDLHLRLYECEPAHLGAVVIGLHLHHKLVANKSLSVIKRDQQNQIQIAAKKFFQGKQTDWGFTWHG